MILEDYCDLNSHYTGTALVDFLVDLIQFFPLKQTTHTHTHTVMSISNNAHFLILICFNYLTWTYGLSMTLNKNIFISHFLYGFKFILI